MMLGIAGMSMPVQAQDKGSVGIAMPTKSSLRWISDGNELVKALQAKGYKTDLQYAEDDIPNQLAQIENMVTKGAKALIIASIDGTTLSATCCSRPRDQGIKVIAYDRLIRESAERRLLHHLRQLQGRRAAGELAARRASGYPEKKGPFNIELFGGSPDDNNAFFFYDGAMSRPAAADRPEGRWSCKSGQMGMDKVGTLRWDGAVAQARMDNLLSAYYSDGSRVDAVLSPYDGLSRGIISSLRGVGYGSGDQPWPIVTGQDAEVPSVKAIIAGEQYSTVFKDTRELAKVTADLVDDVLSGKQPEVNDTKTYNNGVKVVPSYLLAPVAVDKSNYEKIVVDSGYIKARRSEVIARPGAVPRSGARATLPSSVLNRSAAWPSSRGR